MEKIIMKELKDIIDQLEFVSYDDCTKELSASENALVILGTYFTSKLKIKSRIRSAGLPKDSVGLPVTLNAIYVVFCSTVYR